MGDTEYHNVRLSKPAYRKLAARKQEGESLSDVVDRLAEERSLLDLTGMLTDDEATTVRDAIQEEEVSRSRLDRLTDRMDP